MFIGIRVQYPGGKRVELDEDKTLQLLFYNNIHFNRDKRKHQLNVQCLPSDILNTD